jgi:hypothetical protein
MWHEYAANGRGIAIKSTTGQLKAALTQPPAINSSVA